MIAKFVPGFASIASALAGAVGTRSGRFLWLLTRQPRPPEAERLHILARVEQLGYDTDLLRYTQHPGTGP